MVRNIQLKHSGKYVCVVHTEVDTVSAAADLIVRGTHLLACHSMFLPFVVERLCVVHRDEHISLLSDESSGTTTSGGGIRRENRL